MGEFRVAEPIAWRSQWTLSRQKTRRLELFRVAKQSVCIYFLVLKLEKKITFDKKYGRFFLHLVAVILHPQACTLSYQLGLQCNNTVHCIVLHCTVLP